MSDHIVTFPFSPDSKRFAFVARIREGSGRENWRVKIFESETGRDICTLVDFAGLPRIGAFDQNGGRLALVPRRAGAVETNLRIWDLDRDKELLAIDLKDRQFDTVLKPTAFSPDGTSLAALTKPSGSDASISLGDVRVWDADSGKERLRFETRPGSSGIAYSRDGRCLLEIGGACASHRLRDARSGKEILELTSDPSAGNSLSLAFSPDGRSLAVSSADGKLRIWDIAENAANSARAPEHILDGKPPLVTQVAWSADGRRISTGGYRGTVMTWQVASRERRVVVKGTDQSKRVTATVAAASLRFAAAFEGPDDKTTLKVWDDAGNILFTTTEAPTDHDATSSSSCGVQLSPDGTRLAFAVRSRTPSDSKRKEIAEVRVWDIATRRQVLRRDDERGVLPRIAFSPDGRRLATVCGQWSGPQSKRKHYVLVSDLETGRELLRLDGPNVGALTFSPDGRRLAGRISTALGSDEMGELRVWDAATGEAVLTRQLANGRVPNVAWSGDGTLLALDVGGVDAPGLIKVLDARTGRERLSLAGHAYEIWKLAFSPDGRRLASLARVPMHPHEVKLWDVTGGREILTLQTDDVGLIRSDSLKYGGFAFSPDGQRLFYVPGGNRSATEVQVWDATPLPNEGGERSPRREYPLGK